MKESDNSLLQILIARLHARESSSLAFLAISSSASLVFLGFVLGNDSFERLWFLPIFGIIFPVFGLLYFEITLRTIQKHDHYQIRKLVLKNILDKDEEKKIKDIILYNKHRLKRASSSRILLFTPIFAWLITIPFIIENEFSICLPIVGIVLTGFALCWLIYSDKMPKNEDE